MQPFIYFFIEFIDELVFGVREAAWPLIRDDLSLTYVQIGVLLSLPGLLASFIEPFIAILGDVWKRRALILGGGVVFVVSVALTSLSGSFAPLLAAFVLFYPASGAFVSLSQAALMDTDPDRHDQNMARWTLAGSLGVTLGPLLLGLFAWVGFGWQGAFAALAGLALLALAGAWRIMPPDGAHLSGLPRFADLFDGLRGALAALRRGEVLRWLVLLEFSDLMLDVLLGYLALYFADVAGLPPGQAALAVMVWLVVGLLGDFLLISLLERVDGLVYLRWSVWIILVLFPLFLLAPWVWAKLALVGLMGFFNAGWYAILKGRLYSSMPGQSATVMALDNVARLVGSLIPLGIGVAAQAFGLGAAMWLLLAGPLALLIGLPRVQLRHAAR